MRKMPQPPQILVDTLNPHLARVGPLIRPPPGGELSIYVLYVQGATTDRDGKVDKVGDGTFAGPLDPSKREMMYLLYPHHMPSLRERIESAETGKLLIVTCEIAGTEVAGSSGREVHYAVLAIP
jgi:hypothetical protein